MGTCPGRRRPARRLSVASRAVIESSQPRAAHWFMPTGFAPRGRLLRHMLRSNDRDSRFGIRGAPSQAGLSRSDGSAGCAKRYRSGGDWRSVVGLEASLQLENEGFLVVAIARPRGLRARAAAVHVTAARIPNEEGWAACRARAHSNRTKSTMSAIFITAPERTSGRRTRDGLISISGQSEGRGCLKTGLCHRFQIRLPRDQRKSVSCGFGTNTTTYEDRERFAQWRFYSQPSLSPPIRRRHVKAADRIRCPS